MHPIVSQLQERAYVFPVFGPGGQRTLHAWLTLHILGGQILLPALCATFAFTRVKRHPIFISLCASWTLTSILACVLFYHRKGFYKNPGEIKGDPVCLAQASLYHHAAPPMVALSAFALMFHVFTRVRSTVIAETPQKRAFATLRTTALLTAPYIAFAIFGIASSVVVSKNVNTEPPVINLGLYCGLDNEPLAKVRSVFICLVLLATAYYQVRVLLMLRRKPSREMDSVERALFMRVMAYGFYLLFGLVLAFVSMIVKTVVSDIYIATVPLAIFLIFACQKDVLTAWCFWKKADPEEAHTRRPSLTPLNLKTQGDAA